MAEADNSNDLTVLVNTPAQAESLQHSLKQAAGGIGFFVKANKTEFMCFKHFIWKASEISKPVHIPQQQYLIY